MLPNGKKFIQNGASSFNMSDMTSFKRLQTEGRERNHIIDDFSSIDGSVIPNFYKNDDQSSNGGTSMFTIRDRKGTIPINETGSFKESHNTGTQNMQGRMIDDFSSKYQMSNIEGTKSKKVQAINDFSSSGFSYPMGSSLHQKNHVIDDLSSEGVSGFKGSSLHQRKHIIDDLSSQMSGNFIMNGMQSNSSNSGQIPVKVTPTSLRLDMDALDQKYNQTTSSRYNPNSHRGLFSNNESLIPSSKGSKTSKRKIKISSSKQMFTFGQSSSKQLSNFSKKRMSMSSSGIRMQSANVI